MPNWSEMDLTKVDLRALPPEQRGELHAEVQRRARIERALALARGCAPGCVASGGNSSRGAPTSGATAHAPGDRWTDVRGAHMSPDRKALVQQSWRQICRSRMRRPACSTSGCSRSIRRRAPCLRASTRPSSAASWWACCRWRCRGWMTSTRCCLWCATWVRATPATACGDAHYASVGAALLWTLRKGLGEAWTAEVEGAWAEVYGLLAGVMREAAREKIAAAA